MPNFNEVKPPFCELDAAHPTIRGAKVVLPLDAKCGNSARDISGNGRNGLFVGSPIWKPGPLGPQLSNFSTANYVTLDTGPLLVRNPFPFWMACIFTNTSTAYTVPIGGASSTSASPLFISGLNDGGVGKVELFMRNDTGATTINPIISGTNCNDGQPHLLALVAYNQFSQKVIFDNQSAATPDNLGNTTYTCDRITLGVFRGFSSISNPLTGSLIWFAAGNGAVPDFDALYEDLFDHLKPVRRFFHFVNQSTPEVFPPGFVNYNIFNEVKPPFCELDPTNPSIKGCQIILPFDEGFGSQVRDVTTNKYNGKIVGAAKWQKGPFGPQVGNFTTANYVAIDPPQQLLINNIYPYWMAVLAINSSVGSNDMVFMAGSGVSNNQQCFIRYNTGGVAGTIQGFQRGDDGGASASLSVTGLPLNDGLPHLSVMVTYKPSDHRLYFDGKQIATNATVIASTTFNLLTIGCSRGLAVQQPFLGSVLWAAVGNGAAPDIVAMYTDIFNHLRTPIRKFVSFVNQSTPEVFPPGLLRSYAFNEVKPPFADANLTHPTIKGAKIILPLDDKFGLKARDISGNKLDGTFVGGPVWQKGPLGPQVTGFGNNIYIKCGNLGGIPFFNANVPFWLAALVSTTNTTGGVAICIGSNTGAQAEFAYIGYNQLAVNSKQVSYYLRGNTGNSPDVRINSTTVPIQDGNPHLIMGVTRKSSDHAVYFDGNLVGSQKNVANSNLLTSNWNPDSVVVGNIINGATFTNPFFGNIIWAAAGAGDIPDPAELAADLFAHLEPNRHSVYFSAGQIYLLSANIGGSLNSSIVGNEIFSGNTAAQGNMNVSSSGRIKYAGNAAAQSNLNTSITSKLKYSGNSSIQGNVNVSSRVAMKYSCQASLRGNLNSSVSSKLIFVSNGIIKGNINSTVAGRLKYSGSSSINGVCNVVVSTKRILHGTVVLSGTASLSAGPSLKYTITVSPLSGTASLLADSIVFTPPEVFEFIRFILDQLNLDNFVEEQWHSEQNVTNTLMMELNVSDPLGLNANASETVEFDANII